MTEFLNQLLDNSHIPFLTAFLLGLLTAISPCPLATNITAVGFISKDLENRNAVFVRGLLYTLGRTISYTALGSTLIYIIRSGEDVFDIQQAVGEWGARFLGPLLVVVGIFMLIGHRLNLPKFGFSGNADGAKFRGWFGALMLGALFALAFCPSSAMFFFGMLVPMSSGEGGSYWLPVVYAVATSLPVLVVAWIVAFSIKNLGRFLGGVRSFQKWLNIIVAVLFLIIGVYYCITVLL